ncbi:MAG: DUF2889 domain-containing protein [Comamonadaceae bacterium]|nr:MAG: DUF2889 domain-containing protein [Comamonadaceae bacterium]
MATPAPGLTTRYGDPDTGPVTKSTLPPPQARQKLHTRQVVFQGFKRDDGLWDIEANLVDSRSYDSEGVENRALPAGASVHDMSVRVTVGDDMVIREIASGMQHVPFFECQGALDPIQQLVGCKLGPGWRRTIEEKLGGVKSCTHLRELLFNVATAAYQTIPVYRGFQQVGTFQPQVVNGPPFHMGQCKAWDFNGPVIRRNYPQFVGWKSPARAAVPQPATDKPGE